MPQARDEAGNIWETDAQGNAVRLVQAAPQQGGPPADPGFQYEGPQAAANLRQTQAQTVKAEADATAASIDAEQSQKDAERLATAEQQKTTRQAFRTQSVLEAIREARKIAQDRGGTGWESLLRGVPSSDALALKTALDPIRGNLSFGRLQEMRDESVTGGALGQVSNIELELLASTVASLDQSVDLPTFLDRLDKVEQHFINAQLSNDGYATDDPRRQAIARDEFGYSGVFEGEEPTNTASLGRQDATETATELPPEYQAQHLRYLRDNWGQVSPQEYARFRASLDEAYGFTPDLSAYANAVEGFNAAAQQGLTPDALGAVPNPTRELGAIEQGINYAAQSAPGAFLANAGNAVTAGTLAQATGDQQNLDLLREARPVSSMLGEIGGSALGAAALGGVGGAVGRGTLLANPLTAELVHGTVQGATQDDNLLRGAATGFAGTLAGDYVGRRIGQALPGMFAPDAIGRADASVPTRQQVSEQASELYGNMQRNGVAATPDQTADLQQRLNTVLAQTGRIGGDGSRVLDDGPTSQATRLIDSYEGVGMSPRQAQTARERLAEGLMAQAPQDRMIAGRLLDQFDDWAEPVLPGYAEARGVAQRGIQARQIENLTDRSIARGTRQKGNNEADALRTAFGQLDERNIAGQARFTPETQEAISRVAQGDGMTNALRTAGKFGMQNPLTFGLTSGGIGGAAYAAGVDPLVSGGLGLGVAGLGSLARNASQARTLRAAQEAELTALGGPEYVELLEEARRIAANRSRGIFGGAAAAVASQRTRQPNTQPRQ